MATSLPQIQFLEKIIALVVDDDESREIFHLDAPCLQFYKSHANSTVSIDLFPSQFNLVTELVADAINDGILRANLAKECCLFFIRTILHITIESDALVSV